jgi:dolichol-phosphate mannosyltransferase
VSLRGLWRLAKTAIFSFSTFPLFLFTLIGYGSLAMFAGLSAFSLFCRLFTNLAIPGWTSTVLVASFFGAINALGISMLGEYVSRIYDQVRNRPLYLVDRAVNMNTSLPSAELSTEEKDAAYEQLLRDAEELIEIAHSESMAAEASHVEG